jgi:hypothetical protein
MRSILWVTPKPAATLIIARTTASPPTMLAITGLDSFTKTATVVNAPRTVMPLRAFMPDIRGVWSRLGTFLMMLYPRRVATIKIPTKIKGDIVTSIALYDLI